MPAALRTLVDRALRHPARCVSAAVLVSLLVRLAFTPFGLVLVSDAYAYVVKALEIARGDLTPMRSHAIGWPLAMAPAWLALPDMAMTARMDVARALSCVLGAATVVPVYGLARALLGAPRALLVVALFTFSPVLVRSAGSAMTEPLFTLLFVVALWAALDAGRPGVSPLLAPAVAGLSFWVRKDGLFIAAVVLAVLWLRWRAISPRPARLMAAAALAFVVVAAPPAWQRYRTFGSPTDFGANNKYFVDEREHVWSSNVPTPGFLEYVRTHGAGDLVDKLVWHGFLKATRQVVLYAIGLPLLPFFAWGLAVERRNPAFVAVPVSLTVWLVGLTPVTQFYDSARHVYPILPLLLVPTAAGVVDLARRSRSPHLWGGGLLAVYAAVSLGASAYNRGVALQSPDRDGPEWGRFVATHVKGKVALVEEASFVMMHLPDASVAGVGLMDLYAPRSGLSTVRPGSFARLSEAMTWMRSEGVTHLVVDELNVERRPYLKEIDPGAPPPYLELLYSNFESGSRWKVRVYAIRWERLGA
jgi:hypothetical protein